MVTEAPDLMLPLVLDRHLWANRHHAEEHGRVVSSSRTTLARSRMMVVRRAACAVPGKARSHMTRVTSGALVMAIVFSVSVGAQWPRYAAPGVPRDENGQVRTDAPTPRMAAWKRSSNTRMHWK